MDDATTTFVLLPRYTSFAGATTFACAPINARAFPLASLTLWRGGGVAVDDVDFVLEGSQDLQEWEELVAVTPDDDDETLRDVELDREWIRLTVTVNGTDPTVCAWALGEFVKRVGA